MRPKSENRRQLRHLTKRQGHKSQQRCVSLASYPGVHINDPARSERLWFHYAEPHTLPRLPYPVRPFCAEPHAASTPPTPPTTPTTPTTAAALPGSPTQTNSTSASASPASPVVAAALGGIAAAGVVVAVFTVAYRAHLLRQRRRLGAAMRSQCGQQGRIVRDREMAPRGLC